MLLCITSCWKLPTQLLLLTLSLYCIVIEFLCDLHRVSSSCLRTFRDFILLRLNRHLIVGWWLFPIVSDWHLEESQMSTGRSLAYGVITHSIWSCTVASACPTLFLLSFSQDSLVMLYLLGFEFLERDHVSVKLIKSTSGCLRPLKYECLTRGQVWLEAALCLAFLIL